MKYSYSYLVRVQFLGFRFHGWQKQTNAMSLHEIIDKTLSFVFKDIEYKSIGMGRTDSKVSASHYYFQLFTHQPIEKEEFIRLFNKNAPQDIRTTEIREVSNTFNIIQSEKVKEYHYYFSNEGKNHPYASPFLVGFENLNIDVMKDGAKLFEGEHYFGLYCTKPSKDTVLHRTINSCEIVKNDILKANFFPATSYVLKVKSKGFFRYQIRLMMGSLIELGLGNLTLQDIADSLHESENTTPLTKIAAGSGLHLYNVEFLDIY